MYAVRTLLYTSLFIGLTACSSSSDNNSNKAGHTYNTAPTQITKANALKTASLGAGGITSLGQGGRDNTQSSKDFFTGETVSFFNNNLSRAAIGKSSNLITKATQSSSTDCDSGNSTFNLVDVNDNEEFDQGDSLSINYNNCVERMDDTTLTMSGSFSIKLNKLIEDPLDVSILVSMDKLTFEGDQGSRAYIDGGFTLSAQSDNNISSFGFRGSKFEVNSDDSFGLIEDFNMQASLDESNDSWSQTAKATITSTELNGKIIVTTISPLVGSGDNNPHTGSLRIDGAQGSYVIIDADTGDVNTANLIINDGSSTTSKIVNWSEISLDTLN